MFPLRIPYTFSPYDFEVSLDVDQSATVPSIIEVASFVDLAIIERLHSFPEELKRLDRRVFEELVAELFCGFGYQVELTKRTKDGGIDVVAIKNDQFKVKFLIQCKRPDPGNPVGIEVVRDLRGVLRSAGNQASKDIIATTTRLTRGAKQFITENEWDLEGKEYDDIHTWIKEYLSARSSAPR